MKTTNQILKGILTIVIAGLFVSNTQAEKVIKEERNISNVNKLSVSGGIVVNMTQGTSEELTVMAPESKLNQVSTDLSNGILKIDFKGEKTEKPEIYVYLTVSNLDFLQASSSARVKSYSTLTFNGMQLFADGSSTIDIELKSEWIKAFVKGNSTINLSGNVYALEVKASNKSKVYSNVISNSIVSHANTESEVTLAGKARNANLFAYQQSIIKAAQLKTKKSTVDASDDSNVLAYIEKSANLTAKNRSDITISGTPAEKKVLAADDCNIIFQ